MPHVGTYVQSLIGSCFYRLEGWWTYEFCFPKSIRQFHQEKVKSSGQPDTTTITQDYTLGRYWVPEKSQDETPADDDADADEASEGAAAAKAVEAEAMALRGELLDPMHHVRGQH